MALSELEFQRCEQALIQFMARRRPPPEIRDQLDTQYRISGHSVEIFEIRPFWQDHAKKVESPIAKATFVRTKELWRVFWMRQDLKWHSYQPSPEAVTLESVLDIVDRDEFRCFFG